MHEWPHTIAPAGLYFENFVLADERSRSICEGLKEA